MSKNSVACRGGSVAALFIALGSVLSLRAMNLDFYELDSLAYLATAVVEGEISSNYVAHGRQLVDFKISLALKGDFKPGQHVVIADAVATSLRAVVDRGGGTALSG